MNSRPSNYTGSPEQQERLFNMCKDLVKPENLVDVFGASDVNQDYIQGGVKEDANTTSS